ncbi:MAG: nitrite/sulfite reductase [Candidatus Latescibacterota bacterium]
MTQPTGWKEKLGPHIPADLGEEIDTFDTQIQLRRQGRMDEKLFAETRLRRGVYGQRYDNGQRFDGRQTQRLAYPEAQTKGPDTLWHAPGMQRIKIPFGGLTARQLEVLADLAEEYSDEILHVTTRQDIQLHYVHIGDTPDLMRRLAAVGITTREACGNSVRNVTACPIAGVCHSEAFDVTPHARALARFLLGHPDCQDFGRKFKIAFSGCRQEACALAHMHDIGAVAVVRREDGRALRGFEFWVGGGLGPVPHQAQLLTPFLPETELLPTAQAIARVFARLGEKRNRNRARLKFLVARLGIEEFGRLVEEERRVLPADRRWTSYLEEARQHAEGALRPAAPLDGGPHAEGFEAWRRTNVRRQPQAGYVVATVALPLGDLTAQQGRDLASLCRRYVADTVRTTVEQNIVLRWVSEADLPALYRDLQEIGLAEPGAGTIVDITACPGTDTCKLGIASSRGLAAELRRRLAAQAVSLDEAVGSLRIKISGCFNSCGQHHVADLGFFGNSRRINGVTVPHFQVVLGGQWTENAGSFGLAMGAVPSRRIPELVDRLTRRYVQEREPGEGFQRYVQRTGKRQIKTLLDELAAVPAYDADPSFYRDWGDPREFSTDDIGRGECAGEVVPLAIMELAAAEREVFEAQIELDESRPEQARATAYGAMVRAARTLVKQQYYDVPEDPDAVVAEFRARYHDTGVFAEGQAAGRFAHYLFAAHEDRDGPVAMDGARRLVEEARLFVEAAYGCYDRLSTPVAR